MTIDALVAAFRSWDLSPLSPYLPLLSTKYDGEPLPPYVPLVGDRFGERRVLAYATAQSLRHGHDLVEAYGSDRSKSVARLYYPRKNPDFTRKWKTEAVRFEDVPIKPYAEGPMVGLLGMFLYARYGDVIPQLSDVHAKVAVTNYYKFSLRKSPEPGASDLNPASAKAGRLFNLNDYWSLNDALGDAERKLLRPETVVTFRGRHVQRLKETHADVVVIRDPAWLRRAKLCRATRGTGTKHNGRIRRPRN